MPRAKKTQPARLEGARREPIAADEMAPENLHVPVEYKRGGVSAQNTANKRIANPVPGDDGEALARIVASFRQRFPDEWAEWSKCPLESGLPAMAELLKGKG